MKYNYTNPIMKQVAELCDKGHWPICQNETGSFAIFMPITDEQGCIRQSGWYDTIEEATTTVGLTSLENWNLQPTKIIGFWHPPTPQFEVGDKVKVTIENFAGFEHFVTGESSPLARVVDVGQTQCTIIFDNDKSHKKFSVDHYQLEPVLDSQTLELTLDEIAEKFGVDNIKIKK